MTVGLGEGFGGFFGRKTTTVTPLSGRKDRLPIQMGVAYYSVAIPSLVPVAIALLLM